MKQWDKQVAPKEIKPGRALVPVESWEEAGFAVAMGGLLPNISIQSCRLKSLRGPFGFQPRRLRTGFCFDRVRMR